MLKLSDILVLRCTHNVRHFGPIRCRQGRKRLDLLMPACKKIRQLRIEISHACRSSQPPRNMVIVYTKVVPVPIRNRRYWAVEAVTFMRLRQFWFLFLTGDKNEHHYAGLKRTYNNKISLVLCAELELGPAPGSQELDPEPASDVSDSPSLDFKCKRSTVAMILGEDFNVIVNTCL